MEQHETESLKVAPNAPLTKSKQLRTCVPRHPHGRHVLVSGDADLFLLSLMQSAVRQVEAQDNGYLPALKQ